MNERLTNHHDRVTDNNYFSNIVSLLYLPLSLLYMEILAKIKIFGSLFDGKFHYMLLLSLSMGFLLSIAATVLPGKPRRIVLKIVLALLAVWFSFHITYHSIFHSFFSWQTLGQAADVTQFWKEALTGVLGVWYVILALFVPLIVLFSLGSAVIPDGQKGSKSFAGVSFMLFLFLYILGVVQINKNREGSGAYSPYYYYTFIQSDLDTSYRYYGIANVTRLDIKQLCFGAPVEELEFDNPSNGAVSSDDVTGQDEENEEDAPKDYGYNMMNIDFDAAAKSTKGDQSTKSRYLRAMDNYFKTLTPTKQNQYTGMFKGKNLIFITLEGFSDKFIDPEFTPVLYKMATEGFVFRNSYNCAWGGSTATGEYANMTGNFYTTANCLLLSSTKYEPFVLGNQFKSLGYKTLGYHNNTYTYYDRDKSHPNFGYEWKGIGNGLELPSNCWPRSDKEMAEATIGDYVDLDVPFHAYYMSVSGHCNYSFIGNMMSTRHRKEVPKKYDGYPEDVRAFVACQYEVELMLEVLVQKLEEAGKLEDTVFAMAADHYPYAMSDAGLAKFYDLPKKGIRTNVDLYRNQFILWCASMKEPVVVDTPCSTIDIVPTLSNLFGLEYDSRILMGTDILGDGEHFALVKAGGWSWVSAEGTYKAAIGKFIPSENCTLSKKEQSEYAKRINQMVKAKTTYSLQILNQDYYRHIWGFVKDE